MGPPPFVVGVMRVPSPSIARAALLVCRIAVTVFSLPALAQTLLSPPGPPDPAVAQARAQAEGRFGELDRPGARRLDQGEGEEADGMAAALRLPRGFVGGQVQRAWDDAPPGSGVYEVVYCAACTYKVRLREYMVTVIELPEGERISGADIGDGESFEVRRRGTRFFSVRPAGYGVDSNLVVFGVSGRVYPIYLRAERFNSIHVPDLLVRILHPVRYEVSNPDLAEGPEGMAVDGASYDRQAPAGDGRPGPRGKWEGDTETGAGADVIGSAAAGIDSSESMALDFVTEVPFDPAKLRGWGDYEIWGDGPDANDLRPVTVFRDDHFTYLRFDEKWSDLELPAAYVVVDGIDELVNTRIRGRTYIIESTRRLITLKSGSSFICLRYGGPA